MIRLLPLLLLVGCATARVRPEPMDMGSGGHLPPLSYGMNSLLLGQALPPNNTPSAQDRAYSLTLSAPSTVRAIQLTTGALLDFGQGASDHASSNGTTVTFAGPLATSSTLSSTSLVTAPRALITAATLGTCDASSEGTLRNDVASGVATGNATRLCWCRSTGASVYTWMNAITGTNGTSTTCAN